MRTKVPKMATDPIKKRIVSAIQDSEIRIESELKVLKMAAIAMRDAKNKYHVAFFACRKKDNARNSERYERAAESLRSCEQVFRGSERRIDEALVNIEAEYTRLMSYTTPRVADKLRDELSLYKITVEEKRRRFCKGISEPESTEDLDTSYVESLPEPVSEPTHAPVQNDNSSSQVAHVSIAPMAIDISVHVEKAISATMAALTRRMERKIDEYVASLVIPAPPAHEPLPAVPTVAVTEVGAELAPAAELSLPDAAPDAATNEADASDVTDLTAARMPTESEACASEPAANEAPASEPCVDADTEASVTEAAVDTLSDAELIKQLSEFLASLGDITAELDRLTKEQAEIARLQKTVNDMQRKTMRDQKGVQVNQKVIGDDQTALIAEQNATLDTQRALNDSSRAITEKQAEIVGVQKSVIDAQTELDEAMATVVRSQKELISAQNSIISGNAKNLENQRALTEKQAELAKQQKQTFSSQRQLMREQRAFEKKRTMTNKPADPSVDEQ